MSQFASVGHARLSHSSKLAGQRHRKQLGGQRTSARQGPSGGSHDVPADSGRVGGLHAIPAEAVAADVAAEGCTRGTGQWREAAQVLLSMPSEGVGGHSRSGGGYMQAECIASVPPLRLDARLPPTGQALTIVVASTGIHV